MSNAGSWAWWEVFESWGQITHVVFGAVFLIVSFSEICLKVCDTSHHPSLSLLLLFFPCDMLVFHLYGPQTQGPIKPFFFINYLVSVFLFCSCFCFETVLLLCCPAQAAVQWHNHSSLQPQPLGSSGPPTSASRVARTTDTITKPG